MRKYIIGAVLLVVLTLSLIALVGHNTPFHMVTIDDSGSWVILYFDGSGSSEVASGTDFQGMLREMALLNQNK